MIKKRTTGYLKQDIGLVLLLTCLFIGVITVGNINPDQYLESLIMLIGIFLAIIFAGFKMPSLAIVFAGFQILAYSSYRLFLLFSYNESIPVICYIWVILPIASVASMYLFVSGSQKTELENEILKEQVEEYVMINSLTGLYNLRSLYHDLNRQIAYVERNNLSLSLVIVALKYEQELKKVLSRNRYEIVIQKLAEVVSSSIRLEDKVYSIDNQGSFAIMLTCDEEGSNFVMRRIEHKVSKKDTFSGIDNMSIKVEVKMACVQYDKEEFGNNVMAYKQKVESELQYDV